MHWREIFTARGLSLRILVAVVRIPVTVQLIETGAAALPTLSWVQSTTADVSPPMRFVTRNSPPCRITKYE